LYPFPLPVHHRIVIISHIPLENIQGAIASARDNFTEQTTFNTHSHTLEDISKVLPQLNYATPECNGSPFVPFAPWLDHIVQSQNLNARDVHRILLPWGYFAMLRSARVSDSGRINEDDEEYLELMFPKHTIEGEKLQIPSAIAQRISSAWTSHLSKTHHISTTEKGSAPLTERCRYGDVW
jgi:hypothetical protein